MQIELKNSYKSLEPFTSDELNDFVVITGKNGSGKSQLIQLIGSIDNKMGIKITPDIKRIQVEGMDFNRQAVVNHDNWRSVVNSQWGYFSGLSPEMRNVVQDLMDNGIFTREQFEASFNDSNNIQADALISEITYLLKAPIIPTFPLNQKISTLATMLKLNENQNLYFLNRVCEYAGKSIKDLEQSDFFRTPFEERFIDKNELFSSEIAMVFYNYVKRWDRNSRDWFDKKENKRSNGSFSESDFLSTFPKPWDTVNRIIADHGLDFEFSSLDRDNFDLDVAVNITLKKVSSGKVIAFADLSSGEKVIMALITRLFTSEYYGQDLQFPELLVLDEPDATLHPEMSKLLLDVLEQTFVKRFGIKVFITTHSPSTVALAPEESIYQLTNGVSSSLKHITKDEALNLLTRFIPTLSIGYLNQRQVFVESPTDVAYFQVLHDKLSQEMTKDYRLYFISNAAGSGNSTLVYDLVKAMRNSGSTSIYGIVDWDLKNKPLDAVQVHGESSRYSIENFVLDPIYLMILFASVGKGTGAFGVFEKIKKDATYNQYNLGLEKQEDLQDIAEVYFNDFDSAFPGIRKDEVMREVRYYNGKNLVFPVWYLEMKGHEIVAKLAKVYPGIEGVYRNEGDLQKALIAVMGKSFPFVPSDSVELLERIGMFRD